MSLQATKILTAALDYAERGWRVIPIAPGKKYPAGIHEWEKAATTDLETIHGWWLGQFIGHGIGIATGPESGLWVLDVDVADGKTGDDTLHDLERKYGELPPTVKAFTGRGGMHYYFRYPSDLDITAGMATRLGHGLDVRGIGGQVLAPPTIGPTGGSYDWVIDSGPDDVEVAFAPDWLLELMTPEPEPAKSPTLERIGSAMVAAGEEDSIAARFNNDTTWEQLLTRDGWQLHHTDRNGEQHWTRPGKDLRDGTSATTNYEGRDCLKVFTSSVPALEAERAYSRFGYEAAVRHGGDRSAFATALRSAITPHRDLLDWVKTSCPAPAQALDPEAEPDLHGWEPADIATILGDDYTPPKPELCYRNDGKALFYLGRINGLIGESGGGKSWISQHAAAQELLAGNAVLVVDLEDHVGSYVARLRGMGVPDRTLTELFFYVSPERSFNEVAGAYIDQLIADHNITLAIIDSVGEGMALDGAKPNDDDDTARWFRRLPRRIARQGPAVLLLDHIPKDKDALSGFAIGSQRKRAAIDGTSLRVEVTVAPVKGKEGYLRLVCAKDRNGYYQHGSLVAKVTIADTAQGTGVLLEAPVEVERPTHYMERVSLWLEDNGPASATKMTASGGVTGKTPMIRKAIDVLTAERWITATPLPSGGYEYSVEKPFRDTTADTSWIPNTTPEPVDNPVVIDLGAGVYETNPAPPAPPRPTPAPQGRGGGLGTERLYPRPPRPPRPIEDGGGGRGSDAPDAPQSPPRPAPRPKPNNDRTSWMF